MCFVCVCAGKRQKNFTYSSLYLVKIFDCCFFIECGIFKWTCAKKVKFTQMLDPLFHSVALHLAVCKACQQPPRNPTDWGLVNLNYTGLLYDRLLDKLLGFPTGLSVF